VARRIDQACNRFEHAWRDGTPRIEDFLEGVEEPERSVLLRELVLLDIDYRRLRGQTPQAGDYSPRFPDLDSAWLAAALAPGNGDLSGRTPQPRTTGDGDREGSQPGPAVGDPGTLPAHRLEDYEILEEIAHGAMGVVYKARQISLPRFVALKMILSGHFASVAEVQRFRIEAETIAQLDHPNIVPIYEVGEIAGQPCYSMKLIEGNSLSKDIPYYVENPRAAASLLVQVARAVAHAHERGILHRDLKPSNILLDAHKQPHVADFGLARRVGGEGLTASGAIVGTPEYMAPEQARSEKVLTTAVDVYSLGAVLYTLLSGRPPFKGKDHLETLRQVAEGGPCPPRTLNPRIDRDLEVICLNCLDVEPGGRYPSAQALAEELERWLAGEPIEARRVGRAARLWRWSRRNPVLALLSGAAALLLLMTAVIASVGYGMTSAALQDARTAWEEEARQRGQAEDETDRANQRTEEVRQERDRINGLLYLGDMPQAQRAWEAGDLPLARRLLGRHQPQAGWTDHRSWEWYHLRARTQGVVLALRGHSGAINAIVFGPGGERLAIAEPGGTIKVLDAATGQETAILHTQATGASALSWSPGGRQLATVESDGSVKVWHVDRGKMLVRLPAQALVMAHCPAPAWSPDGKRLATAENGGAIRVWDVAGGKEVLFMPAGGVLALAWSPDGRRLASFGDGRVKVWDAARGEQAFTFWEAQDRGGTNPSLAWSKDSKQVILTGASGDGLIMAWDADKGVQVSNLILQRRPSAGQPLPQILHLRWSPDGTRLASLTEREEHVQLWDTATGAEVLTLSNLEDVSRLPPSVVPSAPLLTWSPDGQRLAQLSSAGVLRVWETSRVRWAVQSLAIGAQGPLAWSADSRHLLEPTGQGAIHFWDVARGERTRSLSTDSTPVCAAAWSRDGRRLATARRDGGVEVWDSSSHEKILSFQDYGTAVAVLSWSPDSRKLAAAGADDTVRVWDLAAGRAIFQSFLGIDPQGPYSTLSLEWSANGRWLEARLKGSGLETSPPTEPRIEVIKVWDASTGRVALDRGRMRRNMFELWQGFAQLLWSPNSRYLATLADGTIQLWDPKIGREALSREASASLLSWTADGRRLVALCRDGTVRAWDPDSGDEVARQDLLDYGKPPAAASWSPEGARLALADARGLIQVWNRSTGKVEATFPAQAGLGHALLWSPSGQHLASTSAQPPPPPDGTNFQPTETVQVWSLATGKEVFRLKDVARHVMLARYNWPGGC
jgi:WD40 repeat protein